MIIFVIWIAINFVFPLFFNSIERQYQNQIDMVVRSGVSLISQFFVRLLQLALIVIVFPNLLIGIIVQNRKFRSRRMNIIVENFVMVKNAVLERDFPNTFIRGFKVWLGRN